MENPNIEHDNKTKEAAPSEELNPDRRRIIESKLKNALLRVLIQEGGEVVLLTRQTTDENKAKAN
jgi:hypothetical protein